MQRVAIVGNSGAGKSTLAGIIAEQIDGIVIELDALFHQADWEPTPTPEFRRKVTGAIQAERWASAGNYSVVMDLLHGSADTIVWLDLPRWLVTTRVAKRSLGRVIRRERLWNGNQEHWRNLISRDPNRNVILWAFQHHGQNRERFEGFAAGKFWAHADVHRLRSRRDVADFVASISAATPPR